MRKLGNFSVRVVDYIFWGLMVLILISAIFSFAESITSGWMKYAIVAMTILFIGAFVFFGDRIIQLLKKIFGFVCNISVARMFLIIFMFVAVTKIFLVFLLDPDASKHPDMATYQSFAYQLAGKGKITEYIYSAFMWKYEVIYGLFLSPVVRLFGEDTKVMLTFLSVLFAILSVLLFDILRVHVGKNKAFVIIMLFNILPVGLFETQLLIHETALLFFYIVSFWFLIKALDNKNHFALRILAVLFSALLIAFGNKINQGGTVVVISYCLYVFIMLCKEKITAKKIMKFVAVIACFLLCFVLVSHLCVSFVNNVVILSENDRQKIEQIQRNELPFGWGLYLGTNNNHPGEWNEEDANVYYQYQDIDDEQEAKKYQKELIEERIQVFKEKPAIIPLHLLKKIKSLWGAPVLQYWYGQGNEINQFILTGLHGMIHKALWGISELTYILLCSIIVFAHKRHNKKVVESFYSPVIQFKMMIVGLTFALILFEVMAKYTSYLYIVLFVIGLFEIDRFCDNSARWSGRFIRRKNKSG